MPNLLHIMDYAPRGTRTFDHFIVAISTELRDRGWGVRFAFGAEPPAEFRAALAETGAGYVVIPFPFTRASARAMVGQLGGFRPDVTQTSFVSVFTLPLLWLKLSGFTRRLVVIDHSSGQTPVRTGWRRWLTALRGRLAGAVVDRVVPVSEVIARRDVDRVYLPADKVRVVYNGIRLDLFPNPPRPPREKVRIVYAGQLIPEKGVLTLLDAYARLRAAGVSTCELAVAGKGAQEAELKAYAAGRELPDVAFLGHVDDMPAYFGAADVVVVPSAWYEAFGLVVAEAMACGAACVVSDSGALPEVVGDAGLVFPSGDAGALCDRLTELVADRGLRERLGRAGRARVESQFTLKKKVDSQVAICEAAIGQRPRPSDSGHHPAVPPELAAGDGRHA